MSDLQTLLYYLEEYEQNKDNTEATAYLDELMVNMIEYCSQIINSRVKISLGYKCLQLRTIISYGNREEYKRLFAAIYREFNDLIHYLYIVRSRTQRIQNADGYDGLDMVYMLLHLCNNILDILNEYVITVSQINDKNQGKENGVFLGTNFEEPAKTNKANITQIVKKMGK